MMASSSDCIRAFAGERGRDDGINDYSRRARTIVVLGDPAPRASSAPPPRPPRHGRRHPLPRGLVPSRLGEDLLERSGADGVEGLRASAPCCGVEMTFF